MREQKGGWPGRTSAYSGSAGSMCTSARKRHSKDTSGRFRPTCESLTAYTIDPLLLKTVGFREQQDNLLRAVNSNVARELVGHKDADRAVAIEVEAEAAVGAAL